MERKKITEGRKVVLAYYKQKEMERGSWTRGWKDGSELNEVRGLAQAGRNSGGHKEEEWPGWGEKLEEKFANRLQKQVDKGGFAWQVCQKKAGEMEGGKGGGENLCLHGQTTQKLERHRLIKMHSAPPP